jgi:hypothetical protein
LVFSTRRGLIVREDWGRMRNGRGLGVASDLSGQTRRAASCRSAQSSLTFSHVSRSAVVNTPAWPHRLAGFNDAVGNLLLFWHAPIPFESLASARVLQL